MSDFKIIIPESCVNKTLNASAETTGNFAAVGAATVTRSTTYSKHGVYSYRVQTAGDNEGMSLTLSALANAVHYVTLKVRGTLPTAWDWSLDNSNFTAPTKLEDIDDDWDLYGLSFVAAQANASTTLYIQQNGAGSGDFYVDGVNVVEADHWTTHVDGDQDGCEWNGGEHTSASTRSGQSRAGGRVYDLQDDYHLDIGGMFGVGVAPHSLLMDEYALLPGGELNNIKLHARSFSLSGVIRGTSTQSNFHSNKQSLENVLAPDAHPKDAGGYQPVRLRYEGAAVHKEIAGHYEGGLGGKLRARDPYYWESVALRFLAPDPFWREIGESAQALDSNDSATLRIVTARLKSTGQWDDLGPPGVGGSYTSIRAIVVGADGSIYMGGDFTNFNGIANADYIVKYDPLTGTYSALGTGMNQAVHSLVLAPDGTLYAGGQFTTAGGVTVNYMAKWNGSAWSALGASVGLNGNVLDLAVGRDGKVYIGGNFTDVNGGGGGTYNRIISYDPATNGWSALSTGMSATVNALTIGPIGILYAGGNFVTAGGVTVNYVAEWDGTSWSVLSTGMSSFVYGLAWSTEGILYAAGNFITAGGATVNYVAQWNGTAWTAMGSGVSGGIGWSLCVGPDGIVYVGGTFTAAGGISRAGRAARWNGSTWAHLDIDLPSAPTPYALTAGKADAVVETNYDLWLGFSTAGTAYFAGKATTTNAGTAPAFPRIVVERSGGTSATLETIRNETTGRELLFNYALLDGEKLTIDLSPTAKSIVSNFFGPRPDAILPNSDFGTFVLQPGDNDVTCFIATAGSPTVTAYLVYRAAYKAQD